MAFVKPVRVHHEGMIWWPIAPWACFVYVVVDNKCITCVLPVSNSCFVYVVVDNKCITCVLPVSNSCFVYVVVDNKCITCK